MESEFNDLDCGLSEIDKTVKDYLGDGLYVYYDGFQFELRANDFEHPTDTVYLEPKVLRAFHNFYKRLGFDFSEKD